MRSEDTWLLSHRMGVFSAGVCPGTSQTVCFRTSIEAWVSELCREPGDRPPVSGRVIVKIENDDVPCLLTGVPAGQPESVFGRGMV
jgi:hypothetical protein